MIASLPMYDWPEMQSANDAFWSVVKQEFGARGLSVPDDLSRDGEHDAHWLQSDLLLSQTCGYPYATRLVEKVQRVATPHYNVEGCDGPTYSSAVVVGKDSSFERLEDVLPGSVAVNSCDSLSGYRCFSPLIGDARAAFAALKISGGHRTSALMVARGEADCAAIDAVCWSLFQQFEPGAAQRLRVLAWGPKFPALPFITSLRTGENDVRLLADGLAAASATREAGAIGLAKCSGVSEESYAALARL